LALLPFLTAGVARVAQPPPKVWIGTFVPVGDRRKPCTDCTAPKIVPLAGAVRVLSPSDGSAPATGDVVVVSPLVGIIARGKIEAGLVAIASFNYDLRDASSNVFVLPGSADPLLVEPSKLDVAAIKQALLRNDVLSGVKRSLAGTEVGAIDLDHDRKADLAVTYGCNAWGDGECQSRGQFFLVRRGTKWVEID
jgi:hypothetical protein